MNQPLVSIIMPAYNMALWIAATLHSVLAQTESNWECLVIDDGSTDATAEIVASFDDSRIRLLQKTNAGVSSARNLGLKEAQGAFIVFLDADDLWTPETLKLLVTPMQKKPECNFSWGKFIRFNSENKQVIPTVGTRLQGTGNLFYDLCVDNFLQFGALAVRSSVARQVFFDETLVICEDRDWLLKILRNQNTEDIPQTIHFYRQRPGSAVQNIKRFMEDEKRILEKILAFGDVPESIKRRSKSAYEFHSPF